MQVSIGVYALIYIFLFIVFPGFIARRFYFNGEFSKQINWNNNILSNFFYSFIIGLLLTLGIVFGLNFFNKGFVDIDHVLNSFDNNYISLSIDTPKGHKFDGFSNSFYNIYLPFICLIYSLAAVTGYFISRLVQIFSFDSRFKILRYGNNWHYLFSGKILRHGSLKKNGQYANLEIKYTYLDVLVADTGSSNTLYSGLFGDYELNHKELNKLEKLHLYRASRYKKINDKTELVDIPGDVFTIMGDKIININSTYVSKNNEEKKINHFDKQKKLLKTIQVLKGILFISFIIELLFSLKVSNNNWYNSLISQSIYVKIICIFGYNTFLGLFTPFHINDEKMEIKFSGKRNYLFLIMTNIVVGVFLYILWK